MIVKTMKHVLVTINRRVAQIAAPIPIHKKTSKIMEDQITILYTPDELQSWEDYKSFPSYMKSSHQKILNSLCVMEECASGLSNMLGNVFNMNYMFSDVQTRESELLNNLKPLGFVSREFSLIKEFILISLIIEYLAILVSCAVAVLMFGLTPTIAALVNRITLDWGRLQNGKRPAAEVMRQMKRLYD